MTKKYVRIKHNYYEHYLRGQKAVLLQEGCLIDGTCLIGFTYGSGFGWASSDYPQFEGYRFWWINKDYLEHMYHVSNNKFG